MQDIGTGTRTALAQVCARGLGVGVDEIDILLGDTASGLRSPVSSGSATLATLAPAVHAAADELRRRVLKAAAHDLAQEAERLRFDRGRIVGDNETSVTLAELHRRSDKRRLQASAKRTANKRSHAIRTCGAQCVEVEVDTDTGAVRVLRVVAAHECGRIINRTLTDSQVIGGITQGLGFALMEGRVLDMATGVVLNANLEDYKIPTVADTPDIVHAALDLPDELANAVGAKGIGEPPIIPTAPAIANAIFDAVGVRIYNTPVSACGMLEALGGPPRLGICDTGAPESKGSQ